jgi:hypothetical protein
MNVAFNIDVMRGGLEYCRASPLLPCHQHASFAVKPAGTMTNDVFRRPLYCLDIYSSPTQVALGKFWYDV